MEDISIKEYGIYRLLELARRNYPKLFTIYQEKQIKEILSNNVKNVITDWFSVFNNGQYDFIHKDIYLSKKEENDGPISLSNIIEDEEFNYIYMHEVLHALFGKLYQDGENVEYRESTFLFYTNNEEGNEIGRGFSEGLKEWLLGKLYNRKVFEMDFNGDRIKTISTNYPLETNIVLQLEAILGEDKILEIAKKGSAAFIGSLDTIKIAEFLSYVDSVLYHNKNIRQYEYMANILTVISEGNIEPTELEKLKDVQDYCKEKEIDISELEEMLADEMFNLNQALCYIQNTIDSMLAKRYYKQDGHTSNTIKVGNLIRNLRFATPNKAVAVKTGSFLEEKSK